MERFFYFHLPKCAGTSLWHAMKNMFGSENVFQVYNSLMAEKFSSMPQHEREKYRVVGGHRNLDFYRKSLDFSKYFCFTTFREPIKRLLSEYYYTISTKQHVNHVEVSKMSLEQFVMQEKSSNTITKLFCGHADAHAAMKELDQNFDRWVLIEDIDELLWELCRRTGMPPQTVPHINKGSIPIKGEIDPDLLAIIRERNKADIEFYDLLLERQQLKKVNGIYKRSSTDLKTVHIVMPTYNSEAYIDAAILSIITQEGNFKIRFHVQDGGSKDSTMSKVRYWQNLINSRSFPISCNEIIFSANSHQDNGMYDAIVAGFKVTAPEPEDLMTWLNSDDKLATGAISTIISVFSDLPEIDFLGGRTALIDEYGSNFCVSPCAAFSRQQMALGFNDGRTLTCIMQEGTFWRARLWYSVGGLNTKFKHAGDWDLWRRFAMEAEYVSVDAITGYHRRRPGQLTSSMDEYYREVDEQLAIISLEKKATFPNSSKGHIVQRTFATERWKLIEQKPIGYNSNVMWRPRSGFADSEGPFPDQGIDTSFRWAIDPSAEIEVFNCEEGRRILTLAMRNIIPKQKIKITVEDGSTYKYDLPVCFPQPQSINLDHFFPIGWFKLKFNIDKFMTSKEGRKLGVIVSSLSFQDSPNA